MYALLMSTRTLFHCSSQRLWPVMMFFTVIVGVPWLLWRLVTSSKYNNYNDIAIYYYHTMSNFHQFQQMNRQIPALHGMSYSLSYKCFFVPYWLIITWLLYNDTGQEAVMS